jgi:betaine lipid synthase
LCKTAQKRFDDLGWKNVQVICGDACLADQLIPEGPGSAALVTFSYSLSMIPNAFAAVDCAKRLLNDAGFLGIADFGVSERYDAYHREYNWLMRWFWQIWFDFDYVSLNPLRRKYVEYSFHRVKEYSGVNFKMFGAPLPFYVYLGSKIPLSNHEPGMLSNWRMELDENQKPAEKMYSAASIWDDSEFEMKNFDLKDSDNLLVVTSSGSSLLGYADSGVQNIWAVDTTPAQNDLTELKLAALSNSSVSYEEFWSLFGEGNHQKFDEFLDLKLVTQLSVSAYRFWKVNSRNFSGAGLYSSGRSGKLVALYRTIAKSFQLDSKNSLPSWFADLLSSTMCDSILSSTFVLQNLFGIPARQAFKWTLQKHGKLSQYFISNLKVNDPTNHFSTLALEGHFTKDSHPSYLKRDAYEKLKGSDVISRVRLLTGTIIEVLRLPNRPRFTKILLMDRLDCADSLQVVEVIEALWNSLESGSQIFWKSVEAKPWFNEEFQRRGFDILESSTDKSCIHLSAWKAIKPFGK